MRLVNQERPNGPAGSTCRSPCADAKTPSGALIEAGPRFETLQEALALIGAGLGAFIVGAQVTRYYARDDIACIPFCDAPPLEWIRAVGDAAGLLGLAVGAGDGRVRRA
ncbi:hypothetical protein [Embleya sp. NPDC020630]|uniref:hypothetical protein n=1 Tax=Embleya sp. NPDC020630 TaxID=3363979 RepID=UPI00379468B8